MQWGAKMNLNEIVRGQLVRVVSNGVVGQVRQVSEKGNVGIMVNGNIRWVKPADLEPRHE